MHQKEQIYSCQTCQANYKYMIVKMVGAHPKYGLVEEKIHVEV